MSKKRKRKTRQEKIILQLKRELASQKPLSYSLESEPRQGAILKKTQPQIPKRKKEVKTDKSVFSYNPRLIRNDLLKTLALTAIILSLEFVLYLRLG